MSNASVEDVTKAVKAAGLRLDAGNWETKTAIISLEMPGKPPEVADSLKKSGQQTVVQCYTDDELDGPIGKLGAGCMFADFTMGNGSLRGTATCKLPQGETIAKIKARYAPDKFDYEAEATSSMPDGQSIKATMTISGRRTGGCTPDRKANLPK